MDPIDHSVWFRRDIPTFVRFLNLLLLIFGQGIAPKNAVTADGCFGEIKAFSSVFVTISPTKTSQCKHAHKNR